MSDEFDQEEIDKIAKSMTPDEQVILLTLSLSGQALELADRFGGTSEVTEMFCTILRGFSAMVQDALGGSDRSENDTNG
jgi:hypothetical protein